MLIDGIIQSRKAWLNSFNVDTVKADGNEHNVLCILVSEQGHKLLTLSAINLSN